MKSPNFWKLNGEVYRKVQNFSKSGAATQVLVNIDVQLFGTLHYCLKEILITFHIFLYFMKKICLVLKLCHLKFKVSGFPHENS